MDLRSLAVPVLVLSLSVLAGCGGGGRPDTPGPPDPPPPPPSKAIEIAPAAPTILYPQDGVQSGGAAPEGVAALPWVQLHAGEVLVWRVSVVQGGYYQLAVTWRDPSVGWGLRAQVMLGQRVLGAIYDETPLDSVRLPPGEHDLAIRNLYWPQIDVHSLSLTPTSTPYSEPSATFCIVQDWHTGMEEQRTGNFSLYLRPGPAGARDREALLGMARLRPDFVVGNGDLVDWGEVRSIDSFATLMASLPCPWYATLGHHETKRRAGARAYMKAVWGPALPGPDTWYTFTQTGVRYVFLDSAYFQSPTTGEWSPTPPADWRNRVGCPPEERAWLRELLADNRAGERLPVVVFTHHTVASYREPPPAFEAAGGRYRTGLPADAAEMLEILQSDPYVRAVFSGHAHFQMVQRLGQVVHVQGAALGEGPMSFLRVLVFGDHLEVETFQPVDRKYLIRSAQGHPLATWALGYSSDINPRIDLRP